MIEYEGTSPSQVDTRVNSGVQHERGHNNNADIDGYMLVNREIEIRAEEGRKAFQTEGPSVKKRRAQSIYSGAEGNQLIDGTHEAADQH